MDRLTCLDLPDCVRLNNGDAEIVAATAVGPRILRYALADGPNAFGEYPEKTTTTALGDWKPWAGHRLWASPELFPATYAPDNAPVEWSTDGPLTLRLCQPRDASALRKEITLTLAPRGTKVSVRHTLANEGPWPVIIAPWSITVLRGGVCVLPREPFRSHDESVAVAQSIALFSFTDLEDPRFTLGQRFILLRADGKRRRPQKIGLRNQQGWCAHLSETALLIKRFTFTGGEEYPDLGVNNEAFAAGDYMELEILGACRTLAPGSSTTLDEEWELHPGASADFRDETAVHELLEKALRSGTGA